MTVRRSWVIVWMAAVAAVVSYAMWRHFLDIPWVSFVWKRIIPFLMIPLPLIYALLKRTAPLEGARGQNQADRIRSLKRQLWLGTAAGLGVVIATQLWFPSLIYLGWMLPFLALQQLVVLPLIREKNPAAPCGCLYMPEKERAASLAPRPKGVPPKWAWLLAWGIWIAAVIHCLPFLMVDSSWGSALGGLCFAIMPIVIAPFAIRYWLQQPEPMDPMGDPELTALYKRLRRIKGWGPMGVGSGMGHYLLDDGDCYRVASVLSRQIRWAARLRGVWDRHTRTMRGLHQHAEAGCDTSPQAG